MSTDNSPNVGMSQAAVVNRRKRVPRGQQGYLQNKQKAAESLCTLIDAFLGKRSDAGLDRILRHTYPRIHRHLMVLQEHDTLWGYHWDTAALQWDVRKMLSHLGTTPAAVVTHRGRIPYKEDSQILDIPLQRIYARVCDDGSIRYSPERNMRQLGLVTKPGAAGKMFDARDAVNSVREPSLWRDNRQADNGLELLSQQKRFVGHNEPGCVPQLPTIFAGFNKPSSAFIHGPAAKRAVAAITGGNPAMTDVELQGSLALVIDGRTVREMLCVAPQTATNTTQRWLVRQEYLAHVSPNLTLYEDFSGLCGVEVFNPARLLRETIFVPNPVRIVAVQEGIDYQSLLDRLAEAERISRMDALRVVEDGIIDELGELISPMRRYLGRLSATFSDEDLYSAIIHPKESLIQGAPVPAGSMAEKVDFGFGLIAARWPHLIGKITEDDMRQAMERPNMPLYARHACIIQHIQLNDELHGDYSAKELGRHRVSFECL